VQQITNATASIDATLDGADMNKTLPAAKASLGAAVYQHGYNMDPLTSKVTDKKGVEIKPIHTSAAIVENVDATTADIVASAEQSKKAKDNEGGGWQAWGIGLLGLLASFKVFSNVPVVGGLLEKAALWIVETKGTKASKDKADKSIKVLNQVMRGIETVKEKLPESGGLGKLSGHLDKITDSEYNSILQEVTAKMSEERENRGQDIA
tara:strand:- start:3579 stop:4202 length:624 start_codon:yes stop_codon:yes gene_type:complete